MLVGQFRREARRFSVPHHAAIAAQQSCSNNDDKRLIGRSGMSRTARWKEVRRDGNFADAKTFPPRHAGANAKWGFIHRRQEQKGDG